MGTGYMKLEKESAMFLSYTIKMKAQIERKRLSLIKLENVIYAMLNIQNYE